MTRDRGLTLIELVVAMALFALIAVMGVQALSGSLRMRDRLAEIDTETAQLGTALALLRHDLGAVVPLRFFAPGAPPAPAVALDPAGRVLGLSLAGQPALVPRPGPGLARVDWRFDPGTGTLARRHRDALYPAAPGRPAPEVTVLTGVDGWRLRSFWPGQGWRDGVPAPAGPGPEDRTVDADDGRRAIVNRYAGALPAALELTLELRGRGRIVLVESLK